MLMPRPIGWAWWWNTCGRDVLRVCVAVVGWVPVLLLKIFHNYLTWDVSILENKSRAQNKEKCHINHKMILCVTKILSILSIMLYRAWVLWPAFVLPLSDEETLCCAPAVVTGGFLVLIVVVVIPPCTMCPATACIKFRIKYGGGGVPNGNMFDLPAKWKMSNSVVSLAKHVT